MIYIYIHIQVDRLDMTDNSLLICGIRTKL